MTARWATGLILIAAAAATIGCGSSGADLSSSVDTSTSTRTVLSRAEFVKLANAACARERKGLGQRVRRFLGWRKGDGTPKEVLYADVAHFVVLATIEAEMVRISELRPPPKDEERIANMLYVEEREIDEVALKKRLPSITAAERYFVEAGPLFRAYGLTACANGPHKRRLKPEPMLRSSSDAPRPPSSR